MGTLLSQDLSSGGGRRLAKKICHAAHRLRSTHRTAPIVCEAPKVPSTHSSYVVFVVGIGWALLLLRTSAIPLQQNLTVLSRLRSICYSCNFFFLLYCSLCRTETTDCVPRMLCSILLWELRLIGDWKWNQRHEEDNSGFRVLLCFIVVLNCARCTGVVTFQAFFFVLIC